MGDIKISPITFDMDCSYLNVQLGSRIYGVKHSKYENVLL